MENVYFRWREKCDSGKNPAEVAQELAPEYTEHLKYLGDNIPGPLSPEAEGFWTAMEGKYQKSRRKKGSRAPGESTAPVASSSQGI